MKTSIGFTCLCVYLILVGASLFGMPIPALILGVLALLAGILILVGK